MHSCEKFDSKIAMKNSMICYIKEFDIYGIRVPDGGPACVPINFCPWCGQKFPPSKQDFYNEILDTLGYSGSSFETLPQILETDEWFKDLPENLEGLTPKKVIEMLKLKPKSKSCNEDENIAR